MNIPALPFTLSSPAFAEGGPIPREYSCQGENVSPPLAWSGVPSSAEALVLVVDDPDARGYVHWIAFDMPAADGGLPRGVDRFAPAPKQAANGWRGPCPPSGMHHYRFALAALSAPLGLPGRSDSNVVLEALGRATVIARATLTGTYARL